MSRCTSTAIAASLLLASVPHRALDAQLKGHYVPGFTGLQNGSQPPPGVSVALPIYLYSTNDFRNDAGDATGIDANIDVTFVGPVIAWVTNAKILGANLGGAVAPIAFIKSRIEGASLDVPGDCAYTDMFVQPIQLGWQKTRADFVVGYSLFLPTGKWEQGGTENSGLGMYSHDLQAGTTIRLDSEHKWTVSTLGTYELHSKKNDSDIKVGDILTLEGGLGRSFIKVAMMGESPVPTRVTNVGLVYYAQYKMTADEAPVITPILAGRKDQVFGVGAEGNVILATSGWVFGVRALNELSARNRTKGWTFMLTIAKEIASLAPS